MMSFVRSLQLLLPFCLVLVVVLAQFCHAKEATLVVSTLTGHSSADYVYGVSYSPDGARLVSGGSDGHIMLWNVSNTVGNHTNTSKALLHDVQGSEPVHAVAYSPDGTHVAFAHKWDVFVWDVPTNDFVETEAFHPGRVSSIAYRPDGKRIAAVGYAAFTPFSPGDMDISDAFTGKRVGVVITYDGHESSVSSVAYNPTGTRIATGGSDGIIVWDTSEDFVTTMFRLQEHTDSVTSVVYSPNGAHIASASRDGTIKIWDANKNARALRTLWGHDGCVKSVAYSRDGTRIASGGCDSKIKIWDAQKGGSALLTLHGHTDEVLSVAYGLDITRVASSSADGTIKIWNVASVAGKLVRECFISDASNTSLSDEQRCCAPNGRTCANRKYCFGVMLARPSAVLSHCCQFYTGCQETKDLHETLNTVRTLSWVDVSLSILVLFLLLSRLECDSGQERPIGPERPSGPEYRRGPIFLIILVEIADFAVCAATISIVRKSNALETTESLVDAQCFPTPGDESTINNVVQELEYFVILAILELCLDLAVMVIHGLELHVTETHQNRTASEAVVAIGCFMDVMELVLAVVSLSYFLVPAMNDLEELYESMDDPFSPSPCIFSCCDSPPS